MGYTPTNEGCHEKQQSDSGGGTALTVLHSLMQTPNVAGYGTTDCRLRTPPQSLPDTLSPRQGASHSSYAFLLHFM